MVHRILLNILFFLLCKSCCVKSIPYKQDLYKNDPSVKKLQEYIQINTTNSENIGFRPGHSTATALVKVTDEIQRELAVDFWRRQAMELSLPFAVYRPAGLPVCITTLRGQKPDLPSIVLNSHADVVPVEADLWTYPPFSAHIEGNRMFGRGTQDTKALGIQYMAAIKKLIQNNVTLDRTVHVMVVPDEETGGYMGIKPFIKTDDFKDLNIGFVLDEGMTSSDNTMLATYVDKRPWQMRFNIQGMGGHGGSLKNGSAMEQVQKLIDMAMQYRKQQVNIMNSKSQYDYGAYSTLNINIVRGGVANNVIPRKMSVVLDVRLAVEEKISDFRSMIKTWLSQLSNKTTVDYIRSDTYSAATAVDDSNPYWVALRNTIEGLGYDLEPVVCPATSDMVPIRALGIPAIGFAPKINTISKVHDIDEYIPLDNFLKGIDIYVDVIKNLANIPAERSSPSNCDHK